MHTNYTITHKKITTSHEVNTAEASWTNLNIVALIAALHRLPPLADELQEHLDSVVQQSGVDVSHLSDNEVDEARENVLTPLREIHHQGLEGSKGKATELLIHVDGQPREGERETLVELR